jgi:RNA polymerase sigma-70 factor, ECF subfamily
MEIADAYSEFRQSLLNFIQSKIRSKEDAQDILQNVFTKISTDANSLLKKNNVKHWLFAITRNAIVDYYRANTNKRKLPLDEHLTESIADMEFTDATQGLDQCINKLIALLPDEYKFIVVDSELNGLKQKDMAVKYQMPYSSLKSRVQRGRDKLKALFDECCIIHADRHGNILESTPKNGCDDPCHP